MEPLPPDLLSKIKGCTVLALPQSASRVLDLSKNPENGPPEFARPISSDPGLTAQILRFANSAFFGFPNKITTVQTALSLVSVRTIRNFILWNAVFAFLPDPKVGNFVLRRLIQDSLRRAVFCKCIGSYCPAIDPEKIFVAGLMQDIAVPVLAQNFQKDYDHFFAQLKEEKVQLSKLESARFGWNHTQVGAHLVQQWGIGDDFARNVLVHTSRDFSALDTPDKLSDAIVALSSMLPSANDVRWEDGDMFFSVLAKFKAANVFTGSKGAPKADTLFKEVEAEYSDMLLVTKTPPPSLSLMDFQKQYLESME